MQHSPKKLEVLLQGVSRNQVHHELCRRSFYHFVKWMWPVVDSHEFLDLRHVKVICDHLQAQTDLTGCQDLLINISPGLAKSLLVSVLHPAWEWLRHPEIKTVYGSHNRRFNIRDSRKCKRLIQSPEYQALIPRGPDGKPVWHLEGEPDHVDEFHTSAGGFRQIFSASSGTTGLRVDRVVWDDPNNIGDAFSDAKLKHIIEVHTQGMAQRHDLTGRKQTTVIQQRLSTDDLTGYLLKTSQGKYDHLCLPSEYEGGNSCSCPDGTRCSQRGGTSIGFTDWRTVQGELLCPELYPADTLRYKRDVEMGAWSYASQHQQRPTPKGGSMVKAEWLQHDNDWRVLPDAGHGTWRIGWDLRDGGLSDESCFSVATVWFQPKSQPGDYYLVDMYRAKPDLEGELAAIKLMAGRYPQATLYIEKAGSYNHLVNKLKGQVSKIIWVTPKGTKEERFHVVTPLFAAKNIHLPADSVADWRGNTGWRTTVVTELLVFPQGKPRDIGDSIAHALHDWAVGAQKDPLWWRKD